MKAKVPSNDAAEHFSATQIGRATLAACLLGCVSAAQAGGTISMGPDKSITIGLGLKTSFTTMEDAASDGSSRSSDFTVESARLYTSASLNKYVKAVLNTEKDGDDIKILDGYGALNFMPEFNLQMGRTIVPSDRANLSGGYFLPAWDFAGVASQFYSKFRSRDDGALAWGKLGGDKVVYSAGFFEGRNDAPGASNTSDEMMFAGRVAFNFLDPEPAPAYLTGSTYYGGANIFTVGLVFHSQPDGVGTAAVKDDYSAWGIDALYETPLSGGAGVVTIEGAYSEYDFSTAAGAAEAVDVVPGSSYLISLAYMFPQQVGWGKFQPFMRYQEFNPDPNIEKTKRTDFGVNYLIDGANARITLTYRLDDSPVLDNADSIIVGLQLNY